MFRLNGARAALSAVAFAVSLGGGFAAHASQDLTGDFIEAGYEVVSGNEVAFLSPSLFHAGPSGGVDLFYQPDPSAPLSDLPIFLGAHSLRIDEATVTVLAGAFDGVSFLDLTGPDFGVVTGTSGIAASRVSLGGSILSVNLQGLHLESGNQITVTFGDAASGTPEPAGWALMLVGFGGLGAVLRRQRLAAA